MLSAPINLDVEPRERMKEVPDRTKETEWALILSFCLFLVFNVIGFYFCRGIN